jgi:hypothetical protein
VSGKKKKKKKKKPGEIPSGYHTRYLHSFTPRF